MVEVIILEMTATDGRNFTCVHFITEIFRTELCQNCVRTGPINHILLAQEPIQSGKLKRNKMNTT